MASPTRLDKIITRIKNHRFMAWALVIGLGVVTIAQFTSALQKLLSIATSSSKVSTAELISANEIQVQRRSGSGGPENLPFYPNAAVIVTGEIVNLPMQLNTTVVEGFIIHDEPSASTFRWTYSAIGGLFPGPNAEGLAAKYRIRNTSPIALLNTVVEMLVTMDRGDKWIRKEEKVIQIPLLEATSGEHVFYVMNETKSQLDLKFLNIVSSSELGPRRVRGFTGLNLIPPGSGLSMAPLPPTSPFVQRP